MERPRLRLRPALVIATVEGGGEPLIWTLMITSAANAGWPGDISLIERYAECGLPAPSVVRTAKIATSEGRSAQSLGRLPADLWTQVVRAVRGHLML